MKLVKLKKSTLINSLISLGKKLKLGKEHLEKKESQGLSSLSYEILEIKSQNYLQI